MEPGEPSTLQHLVQRFQAKYEQDLADDISSLRPTDNYLGHVSEGLYSDSFHFILELIQNAIDSAMPGSNGPQRVSVRFHLQTEPERLIASNNGAPFTEVDVRRLCGQVITRKGPRKIGYKGIGFKSVISVTDNPQIYSPGCQFEFNRHSYPDYPYVWLIIPRWIDTLPQNLSLPSDWVSFVLPLKESLAGEGMARLSREMDDLPAELLLFLDGLEKLEIRNQFSGLSLARRKIFDSTTGLTQVEQSEEGGKGWLSMGSWIVTSHTLPEPPEQARRDYIRRRGLEARLREGDQVDFGDAQISLAFRLDVRGRFASSEGSVYAFFPVRNQRSGLRFALQADFLTTASRESLTARSPGDWNDWLLSNVPAAIARAVEVIKTRPDAVQILYSALPLRDDGPPFEDDTIYSFRQLTRETVDLLRGINLIATDLPGEDAWVLPSEAAVLDEGLRGLIDDADLAIIKPGRRALVSRLVSSTHARRFLTHNDGLCLPVVEVSDLLRALEQASWVRGKPECWHRDLISYLADAKLSDEQVDSLRDIPFLPVEGGWACPADEVFLPADEDYYRINGATFLRPLLDDDSEQERKFLKRLNVLPATSRALIDRVVLPALEQHRAGEALSEAVLAEYGEFVRAYANERREPPKDLGVQLRSLLLLRAADGSWRPAATLSAPIGANNALSLAGYLLAGAPGHLLAETPDNDDCEATKKLWEWLGLPVEPPVPMLVEALSEPGWYANRPAVWYATLYTYLDQHATDKQLSALRKLPLVRLQLSTSVAFNRAQGEIFFAPADDATAELSQMLSSASVAFADPTALAEPIGEHSYNVAPLRARALLTKLGVEELNPRAIIQRVIAPAFRTASAICKPDQDRQLLSYTAFVLREWARDKGLLESEAWRALRQAVKIKTTGGQWIAPGSIYLTKAYGGHDFELMLGASGNYCVSADYLRLHNDKQAWRDLLLKLGVYQALTFVRDKEPKHFAELLERDLHLWEYLEDIRQHWGGVLEQSNRHRIIGHTVIPLLKPILLRQDANAIKALLMMLVDFWHGNAGYRSYTEVDYSYLYNGYWNSSSKKPSHIAWLLQRTAVLPTARGLCNGLRTRVYRPVDEIRALVGDSVNYLSYQPTERAKELLSEHLGLIWSADQVHTEDVLNHLRQLKVSKIPPTSKQCAGIYAFLAQQDMDTALEEEELLFLPTSQRSWWRPSELFWKDYSELFGAMRGYVTTEPEYRQHYAIFERLGVNVGDPGPRDWADLLDTVGEAESGDPKRDLIARAYRELERYFQSQANGDDPVWWKEFAGDVPLLMESGSFSTEPFYVGDDPLRHKAFQDRLSFIWLPDSHRVFGRLLEKLYGRYISDEDNVTVEVRPGKTLSGLGADLIFTRLTACRPFIRSILVHKMPDREPGLRRVLDLLLPNGGLVVEIVDQLTVVMRTTDDPVVEISLDEVQQAWYQPQGTRLYVLESAQDDWEAIGLGVATMLGPDGEEVRSEMMQLLAASLSSAAMSRLLDRLRIPLVELPSSATSPSTTGPAAAPTPPIDEPELGASDSSGVDSGSGHSEAESDHEVDAEANPESEHESLASGLVATSLPAADSAEEQAGPSSASSSDEMGAARTSGIVSGGSTGQSSQTPMHGSTGSASQGDNSPATRSPSAHTDSQQASDEGASKDSGSPSSHTSASDDSSSGSAGQGDNPPGARSTSDSSAGRAGAAGGQPSGGSSRPQPQPGASSAPASGSSDAGQRVRAVTYVTSGPVEDDEDDSGGAEGHSQDYIKRGQAAVDRVLHYERCQGRNPEPKVHNHPGYDVLSRGPDGRIQRYIEVKAISGEWGVRGVGMTERQFAEAQQREDDYWLYIVEFPQEERRYRITCIKNVAGRASRFYFDYHWRQIADEEYDAGKAI